MNGFSTMSSSQEMGRRELTGDIVWELEWGYTFGDIHVEYVIVFFSFVELFPALSDRIDDLTDLLPCTC
jgi:hypothetical protein